MQTETTPIILDRLPRDIAQERLHTDIVQLLDEYNFVRSPQLPPSHMQPHMINHALMQNHYLGAHTEDTGAKYEGKKSRTRRKKPLA